MNARLAWRYCSLFLPIVLAIGQSVVSPVLAEQNASHCPTRSAVERNTIARTAGKVVRQQQRLSIKTRQRPIVFQDQCPGTGDDFTVYTLKSYFADVKYFLVESRSIESHEYILINEKTGAKTTLYGIPVFSPDRQRFTAMAIDELNGNTSIEIYRLTAAGAQREYQNTEVKGPASPVWKNNSTIAFQRTLTLGSDPIPATLSRKNGVWKLI